MKKFELKFEELEVAEQMQLSDDAVRVLGVIEMIGLIAFGVSLT